MTSLINDLSTLHQAFAARFNDQDLDGLQALTTPNSVFVPAPGQPVTGAEAVRGALAGYLSLNLPISMEVVHVFQAGTIGLAIAEWSISGVGPDGSAVELGGRTSDVAVYDEESGWRFAIDNPFGTL
jgi:ketosteroid isomerase-like protein